MNLTEAYVWGMGEKYLIFCTHICTFTQIWPKIHKNVENMIFIFLNVNVFGRLVFRFETVCNARNKSAGLYNGGNLNEFVFSNVECTIMHEFKNVRPLKTTYLYIKTFKTA